MIDDGVWSGSNEKLIVLARNAIIHNALLRGNDVVVDDTNLHPKHLKNIKDVVEGYTKDSGISVTLLIRDFRDVPLDICIERDSKRLKPVGAGVIRDIHKNLLTNKKLSEDSIFDDFMFYL